MSGKMMPKLLAAALGAGLYFAIPKLTADGTTGWEFRWRSEQPAWKVAYNLASGGERPIDQAAVATLRGNHAEAVKLVEKCIEQQPENDVALMLQSSLLQQLGRHDEAILSSMKALELNPKDDGNRLNLARICFHAKRYDDAIASLEAIAEDGPQRVPAAVLKADAYHQLHRYRDELKALKAVSSHAQDDFALVQRMALVLAATPDATIANPARGLQAAQYADQLAHSKEEAALALDTLAVAYAAQGDFQRASMHATQAAERVPAEATELKRSVEQHQRLFKQKQKFILPE
jgi:tetratricopeptide (TPR) repeat protein